MDEKRRVIGGKYEIECVLGKGGGGQVFRARDLRLGKQWGIKRVSRDCQGMEERVLSKVDGRLCPRIADVVEEGKWRYLVMDWIDGESLEEHLRKEGPFEVREAVRIGISLCDAILSLHGMQPPVLYLDCKPSNLMRDREGKLWLIDFGSAVEQNGQQAVPISASPGYAAPEQRIRDARLRCADVRSDVFGIGRTLYAILGGMDPSRPPYGACSLTDCGPGVPKELARIVDRCVRERPEERYQTVGALKAALCGFTQRTGRQKFFSFLLSAGVWCLSALTLWQGIGFYGMVPIPGLLRREALRKLGGTLLPAAGALICQKWAAGRQSGPGGYEPLQNVLRTEKKAERWPLLLLTLFLFAALPSRAADALESGGETLPSPVVLRDARMRKLLVKEGSVLCTGEKVYLELSPDAFRQQEELEIRVTAAGQESGRQYGYTLRYCPQKEGGDGDKFPASFSGAGVLY